MALFYKTKRVKRLLATRQPAVVSIEIYQAEDLLMYEKYLTPQKQECLQVRTL